jgi:lantibiotic modifying enzyme
MSERREPKNGQWRPILDGALRTRALASVQAIAADLEKHPAEGAPWYPMQLAEQALFNAYLGFADLGERHFDLSSQFLERAIDAVAETPMRPSLYSGFVGVAWVLEHLQSHELSSVEEDGSEDTDPNEQVDEVLREYLSDGPWNETYDLISGLVGIGVYLSDRMPRPIAKEGFDHVVSHLTRLAKPMESGVTWWTPSEQLMPETRKEYPQGHANLGVAHGVPAAIVLLAEAGASNVGSGAAALFSRSLSWFLSQRSSDSTESNFGYNFAAGRQWQPARAAWCYGDPGIAAALLGAARRLNDGGLEREALEIGLRAALRPAESCGVVDAPLCHGAAGLGHLYNRIFQATGDRRFLDAALRWVESALEMKRDGEGIGGYQTWRPGEGGWTSDRSLLAGATGVALALLAAATPVEPSWDRLLLASVPPI